MKKNLLFAFILIFSIRAFSATYYLSNNSGNDNYSGKKQDSAWKSLSKLNLYFNSLNPGDSILLKRSETFFGSIKVVKSGIFIGTYGTGAKPVITSLQDVNGLKAVTGYPNRYTSDITGIFNSESTPKFLMLDGVLQHVGRWPNADAPDNGYIYGNNTVSSTLPVSDTIFNWGSLSKPLNDWTGGQIAFRDNRFAFNTYTITKGMQTFYGTNTVFNMVSQQKPLAHTGMFLQNRVEALDQNGEWSFDDSTNIASIYLTSSPSLHSIQMPALDYGLSIQNITNVTISDIDIIGYNKWSIYTFDSKDIIIRNCHLYYSGYNGLSSSKTNLSTLVNTVSLLNSRINSSLGKGIVAFKGNLICLHDTLENIMPILGMNGTDKGDGINTTGDNVTIKWCRFNNIAYNGIQFNKGSHINISYNFFDSSNQRLDDGGAIYTVNQDSASVLSYTDRLVKGNIVLNTDNGAKPIDGLPLSTDTARNNLWSAAIYGDLWTYNVTYDGNIIVGSEHDGFYFNDPINVNWYNNVVYNTKKSGLNIQNVHSEYEISGLNFKNNTILNSGSIGGSFFKAILFEKTHGIVAESGNFDSNYYAYPLYKGTLFRTDTILNGGSRVNYYYLDTTKSWQDVFGFDLHSKLTPLYLSTTSPPAAPTKLLYNDTEVKQTYSLNGDSWISAQGVKYSNSITLQPFTAAALIKDTNSVNLSPIGDSYVRDGSFATVNFGSDTILPVKGSPTLGRIRSSYLKFSLQNVKEVGSAKLRLYATTVINPGKPSMPVYGVDNDNWSESGITYNNAPPSSTSALTSVNIVDSERYYEFDVTDYVKTQAAGNDTVSFVLKDTSNQENYVVFNSRENTKNRPQLIIVAPVTIKPSDDAYVRDGSYQNLNYGNDTSLVVKKDRSGYNRKSYLKFSLSSLGNIKSAKLKLYGSNQDTTNITFPVKLSAYGVNNDSWADSTITWNNAPGSITALLDSETVNNVAKYYEFDVTNFVKNEFAGDKTVSFVIKDTLSQNKVVFFNSSENAKFPPQLVVDYSGDSTTINMRSIYTNDAVITKSNTQENVLKNNLSLKAKVYPNPVNNKIHVAFPHTYKGNYDLQIIDISGRNYDLGKHNINAGGYDIDIDVSKLSLRAGQYFIRILSDKQDTQVIKLIVQ